MSLTTKILATALVAACGMATAQTAQPAQTLSPAVMLVQSMRVAPSLQTDLRKSLDDPAAVRRTSSKDMAFIKRLVSLPELELNALIARVMEAGLSSGDLTLISDFYQTPLGKRLQVREQQATSLTELSADVNRMSDSDRQALERFASTGATTRMTSFLGSDQFLRILRVEVEALPVSTRP